MKLRKVKVRWYSERQYQLRELGIEPPIDSYELKEVKINFERISHIEEYDGYCCINFSAVLEDCLITDIPYSKSEYFEQ